MSAQVNRRLNLAFVVHDYHRHGGQSRYVVELATRFRHNHAIHVYANTVDDNDTAGIQFHHVPAWRASALTSILSFVVPATLMIGKHDIVHAQGLCGLQHNVTTAHLITPAWWQARRVYDGRSTWKGWLSELLVTPLERAAFTGNNVKRVIAVSRLTAADIAIHYGRTRNVGIIPHGTDTEIFHPRLKKTSREKLLGRLGLPETAILALFVGNLQKGAVAAVEAIAQIPGTHLLLASHSDSAMLLKHASRIGLADRVHMLGFNKNIQEWMAGADLFLFPTPHDPFGLVVTEAMACGLPVVTTRCAGASDLVTHGRTGWLVDDPRDIDGLAEGVRLLVDDVGLRTRMGIDGRTVAEQRTWDIVAEETIAIYRSLVGEQGW